MASVVIQETTLSAIGDAIRNKTATTELIKPGDMPDKIYSISGGGSESYKDANGVKY